MKIVVKELEKNYNVSEESDVKIFGKFIGYFIVTVIILYICFLFLANILVNFVSLEKENELFGGYSNYDFDISEEKTEKIQAFLGEDFKYEIIVIDNYEANAFALPGGTIAITSSLLDEIKYENSLLFIIGHEIGHIEKRDVFRKVVSEVPLQILSLLVGFTGDIDLGFILNSTTSLYSKTVENNADFRGLLYLNKIKGEVGCATYFFENKSSISDDLMTFVSGHPMTTARINRIKGFIKMAGYEDSETCELIKL